MEFPGKLRLFATKEGERALTSALQLGYTETAVAPELIASLTTLFPNVIFRSVGSEWPARNAPGNDILVVEADSASSDDMEAAINRLRAHPPALRIVVVLRNANVANTRALVHAGAADVLPAPVSEAAMALCLERLISSNIPERSGPSKAGQVVAILKAGGGVGATSLGVQAAMHLAETSGDGGRICFADLDLQFGVAALYFDLNETLSIIDCINVGNHIAETQFATVLAAHRSGVRVLAGPRELTALEALTPQMTESLIEGLRRDFSLTILDLPSVWTNWTNQALGLVDRIVLVTRLSVPHVHLVRRQLTVLTMQKLDDIPLTLVCNMLTSEQQNMLSLKAAQRSVGRAFDILVPEDTRVMGGAINDGTGLAAIRRGTKLEKAVEQVAAVMAADAFAGARSRG